MTKGDFANGKNKICLHQKGWQRFIWFSESKSVTMLTHGNAHGRKIQRNTKSYLEVEENRKIILVVHPHLLGIACIVFPRR